MQVSPHLHSGHEVRGDAQSTFVRGIQRHRQDLFVGEDV